MTLYEFIQGLQQTVLDNPKLADLPVAYSSDDEGNSFHLIHNTPTPCQVEDNTTHYLEMVGYYDEESNEIHKDDINCVIIN